MPLLLLISLVLLVRILCIGTPDPSYPDRSIEQGLGYMWNPGKVLVEELDRNSGDWKTVSMVSASQAGAMDEAVRQVEMSGGTRRLTEVTLWDGLKNIELWIAAAGQVFLSLSVGTGLILTYASRKSVRDCRADELKCAAFVLRHNMEKGHKPQAKDMMKVSDLEALTGFQFFANVPNAPKSSYTPSDWGL